MALNSLTLKKYYRLTKPGIVYGNALTVIGGFFLASKGHINLGLFAGTLFGVCLIMASACVFNNYVDRGLDEQMARTKKRALVTKEISERNALIFATILGLSGFGLLGIFTNLLTVLLGVIAIGMYVVVYGIAKRKTVYGTLVGSVPGALPPVAGYTAVTNSLDTAAILLFVIMVLWQMPHFYAIAMYRYKDYKAAGLPVLPVVKGMQITKIQIILYVIAFIIVSVLLSANYTGISYLLVMAVVGGLWLVKGLRSFKTEKNEVWARGMFGFSLIVLLVFSVMISVDVWLP